MTSTIIKTNGEVVNVEPKNGTDFKLAELQKIVGGYIEVVYLSDTQIMIVNEEGKLNDLDFNSSATLAVRMAGIDDVIVGDVLVCPSEMVK